ncbi:hypothetical protein N0V90_005655 [Kalmusia sp. IMI 367209]|nr:hypothetical protein N0V90_005655 [Kalmusia sp. IMI 367209]
MPAPPRTANGTIGDLSKQWNESLAMAEACAAANKYTTAKYIGTSAVARDLIHFTELQAAAKGKDPKEALINYYGISYGTVLGQTLAAMYPNRLRRVLLDGNVYGVGFYQGWVPNTVDDLDHSVWLFAKLCFEAGAEYCKLSKEASSIAEIESRFANVVDVLEKQPVDIGGTPYGPNEFLSMVQQGLYTPRRGSQGSYRKIDTWASAILSGNTSAIDPTSLIKREEQPFSVNAQLLITAVDISGRYPWQTYEQWKAAADKLHVTAPEWAQNYASTNGLVGLIDIEPPASQLFPGFEKVETSAPILFVNTVADPVTPASSARQMSRLFEGSGVLIVDGPGHGYTNAPSECANEAIAAYWENGQVHAGETWCQTSADASYYFGGPIPEAAFDQEAP